MANPAGVSCTVLGNPFTNMREEALEVTAYTTLPWVYLLDQWSTESWARSLQAPTIVLSSTHDELIPVRMHTEVYNAVGARQKRLVEKEATHNSMSPFKTALAEAMREWCIPG